MNVKRTISAFEVDNEDYIVHLLGDTWVLLYSILTVQFVESRRRLVEVLATMESPQGLQGHKVLNLQPFALCAYDLGGLVLDQECWREDETEFVVPSIIVITPGEGATVFRVMPRISMLVFRLVGSA